MEYASIERELHIAAAPEVVFDVVTNPEHIRDWWSASTEFEPRAGATGELVFADADTGAAKVAPFTVVAVDPPRRFAFRWTYNEGVQVGPENSLLVTFDLIPSGDGTTLRFRETGYRERGWEAAVLEAHYQDHSRGWDHFLPRLVTTAASVSVAR
jgi:uncharacterized protein YndB with AHSA1/START domain